MRHKDIKVVVHYPETEEGKRLYQDTLDTIHAELIVEYIDGLNCSLEEKRRLLDYVING